MDGYIRQREFWMESESIQKFSKTPKKDEEVVEDLEKAEIVDILLDLDNENSIQLHQDNVEGNLGKKIIYKTKGIWEEAIIIRISKSRCAIGIDSGLKKDSTAHKNTLNLPKIVDGKRVGKSGRNIYLLK